MALKDWKKVTGGWHRINGRQDISINRYASSKEKAYEVTIRTAKKEGRSSYVIITNIRTIKFKTKKQALAFARAYMRKH